MKSLRVGKSCRAEDEDHRVASVERHQNGRYQEPLVKTAVLAMDSEVGDVILAEASMATVAEPLTEEVRVPVLSSPRLGVQRAREVLLGR